MPGELGGSFPAANVCIPLLLVFGPGSCRIFLLLCNGLLVSLLGKPFSDGRCQELHPTSPGSLFQGAAGRGQAGKTCQAAGQQKGAAHSPTLPLIQALPGVTLALVGARGSSAWAPSGCKRRKGERWQFGLGPLPGVVHVSPPPEPQRSWGRAGCSEGGCSSRGTGGRRKERGCSCCCCCGKALRKVSRQSPPSSSSRPAARAPGAAPRRRRPGGWVGVGEGGAWWGGETSKCSIILPPWQIPRVYVCVCVCVGDGGRTASSGAFAVEGAGEEWASDAGIRCTALEKRWCRPRGCAERHGAAAGAERALQTRQRSRCNA